MKIIQGHIRPLFFAKIILAHSFKDQLWRIFVWMQISWRHNIWPLMSLLSYSKVFLFFTLRPSDLITTLTYIPMDNFCPFMFKSKVFILYFFIICSTSSTVLPTQSSKITSYFIWTEVVGRELYSRIIILQKVKFCLLQILKCIGKNLSNQLKVG